MVCNSEDGTLTYKEWIATLDQKLVRHYTDGDFLGLHANIAEAIEQRHIVLVSVTIPRISMVSPLIGYSGFGMTVVSSLPSCFARR